MQVVKVDSKVFVEKDMMHVAVFKKKDNRTIYNAIYKDGKLRNIPLSNVLQQRGVTRDKMYDLTQGKARVSRCSSLVRILMERQSWQPSVLRNTGQVKKLKWELDFADLQIKGRGGVKEILSLNTTVLSKLSSKKKECPPAEATCIRGSMKLF